MNIRPADVIDFWMGDVLRDVAHLRSAFRRWFQGGEELDREISERFSDVVKLALEGGLADWERAIRDRVALVILLDQFPRNIYRGTARAFAGDERALGLARDSVEKGEDRGLTYAERVFLLMPFQHVEDLETQQQGVVHFRRLEDEARAGNEPEPVVKWLESTRKYAELHRDIVKEFGRFPHRNPALDRESTAAEERWLREGGQTFGQ